MLEFFTLGTVNDTTGNVVTSGAATVVAVVSSLIAFKNYEN